MSLEVNLEPWQGECQLGGHEETVYLSVIIKGEASWEWTLITICREHFEKAITNAYDIALVFKLDAVINAGIKSKNLYAFKHTN